MIYADNASTTRISPSVLERAMPWLTDQWGNPSNLYGFGVQARKAIENARERIAGLVGASEASEIIFTSGGSEGNNTVLRTVTPPGHIITTSVEHPSVLNTCRDLECRGVAVTYLPVDGQGRVCPDDVLATVTTQTRLVSVMLANNEVGTIQPVAEIARRIHGLGRDIAVHTDAVQAMGHIAVDVRELDVDYLTASAHKFNAMKGSGFLYRRGGNRLVPLVTGGGQERGQRAGTENVAAIVAMAEGLAENVAELDGNAARLRKFAKTTFSGLQRRIPALRHNGADFDEALPGLLSLTFGDVSGEALMHLLDLQGICVSTGSACSAGEDRPSHVLLALGLSAEQAATSVRVSYGRYNTEEDCAALVAAICKAHGKIISA